MNSYKEKTDKTHQIKLESSIEQVMWTSTAAAPKGKVGIEVFTKFVGSNSEISIKISDKSGKKFEAIKTKMSGNHFWKQITVPEKAKEELYAEVKLPKHSLSKKSNGLYLYPAIEIKNLKWDKQTTFQGDILKIKADIKGLADGNEVEIQVWEYDPDDAHDLIAKYPALVKNRKIETEWEFIYQGNVEEIIAAQENGDKDFPQFFYRVIAGGVTEDSDLIKLNWILIDLLGEDDKPIPDEKYKLEMPDGTVKESSLDESGRGFIYDIEKKGECKISFPDIDKDAWEKIKA